MTFPPRSMRSVADWSWRAAAGDVSLEQRALGGIGMAYARAGRRSESLEHLMRALDLARAARDRRHEARWLGNARPGLVAIRAAAGGDAGALRRAGRGAAGGRSRLAGEHPDATWAHVRRRRADGARQGVLHARLRAEPPPRPNRTSRSISSISSRPWPPRPGRCQPAIAFGEQALQLAALGNDRLTEARLRIRLGRLAMSRGDTAARWTTSPRASPWPRPMGQPVIQAQALSAMAAAQAALTDPAAAATYRRASVQARGWRRSPPRKRRPRSDSASSWSTRARASKGARCCTKPPPRPGAWAPAARVWRDAPTTC